MVLLAKHLEDRLAERERIIIAAIADSAIDTQEAILGTRAQVNRLDVTYGNLLEAQKRRSLEGLYAEDTLAAERREAVVAFIAGRYAAASRLYGVITDAHPNDQEARFFRFYALFLSNPQNRDNYRIIKEAFVLLERQGYTRKEMTDALNFIAAEMGEHTGIGEEAP
jgi:hypothetical protein